MSTPPEPPASPVISVPPPSTSAALSEPSAAMRWRCSRCGNLTRFDVTRRTRTRQFLHLDLAGAATVEETEVLRDEVEQVRCRWCDAIDSVELVPRPSAG